MAATPEGRTKKRIRKMLEGYQGLYAYWPVPSGFGKRTVDVLGCYRGRFFAIEAKADGGKPTLLQAETLKDVGRAMGATFVLAGPDDPAFDTLRTWLDELTTTVLDDPHIPPDTVRRTRL